MAAARRSRAPSEQAVEDGEHGQTLQRAKAIPRGVGLCVVGAMRALDETFPKLHEHVVLPWKADVFVSIELRFGSPAEEHMVANATALLTPVRTDVFHPGRSASAEFRRWCATASCWIHSPVLLRLPLEQTHCGKKLVASRRTTFMSLSLKRHACFERLNDHERLNGHEYHTVAYVRPDLFIAKRVLLPVPKPIAAGGDCVVSVNACMLQTTGAPPHPFELMICGLTLPRSLASTTAVRRAPSRLRITQSANAWTLCSHL